MDWIDMALLYAKNVALAILVFIIGWLVIKWITKWIELKIEKSKMDANLKPFIIGIVGALLKVLLVVSVINVAGIPTTSLVAIIAAAGFAIGLAFQGSLSNFAGGVLLLTLRPFKVGDYIEGSGYSGTVSGIQILYTVLTTPDNKVIYIPNGSLSNTGIVNYSEKDTRRVDLVFKTGYENDSKHVLAVLNEIVYAHPNTLKDPEPFIRMTEHGASSVGYTVRVWTKAEDYWTVYFDLIETVKKRFEAENISIPYPQMDIHVNQVQK